MNVNDRSPVTEVQIMACVFGSTYAFQLIAEGPNVKSYKKFRRTGTQFGLYRLQLF